ncbi:unnamed protein product, partial [Effrenium voratum]
QSDFRPRVNLKAKEILRPKTKCRAAPPSVPQVPHPPSEPPSWWRCEKERPETSPRVSQTDRSNTCGCKSLVGPSGV